MENRKKSPRIDISSPAMEYWMRTTTDEWGRKAVAIFLLYYANKWNIQQIIIIFKPIFLTFFNVFIFNKECFKANKW